MRQTIIHDFPPTHSGSKTLEGPTQGAVIFKSPSFAANTMIAPEHMIRIILLFNCVKTGVIVPKQRPLPVGLVLVSLLAVSEWKRASKQKNHSADGGT